ncbi:YciI family protein [Streptomyces scopuliridis]|uniref:Transcriptional regulator n=1 Tax=Streptomyces scopuliridis RB72 TaxID=1440053 RepID=A0A2T7T4M9_9ACTN|nr:YciI family protein [Streptomyces scopuliridis]PVE10066.1 transcriptional regulator [Streptomyces scopuliridis RB72]
MPRYLSTVSSSEKNAPADGPSPELMRRMGELIEEMTRAGVLLDTAGLTPSAQGVRFRQSGGRLTVTDGPFTEAKEVIGGYAIVQAKDKEQAVEWTRRFVEIHGDEFDITVELREIAEP